MTQLNQVGLKVGSWYTIELKDETSIEGKFKGIALDREGIWLDEPSNIAFSFIDEQDIRAIHSTFGTIVLNQGG